ncbi:DNA-binding response regulator [Rhodobacteraceae bacterium WD3A24]|nr:DNA-binding response regulator [Rhodobacteraceae bacterium WD3A24]
MKSRIVLVEDDPDAAELVGTGLRDDGYDVTRVSSMAEFEAAGCGTACELCIVDLGLPDGNGLQLVQDLRKRTDCGIIILTGRSADVDRIIGLEIGADDYITKPFHVRELLARVHAVLRRVRAVRQGGQGQLAETEEDPGAITFDGYRFSPAARRLFAPEGHEVRLTSAEFSLFAALLENRGRVLSRDQLMNAIKGREWESYDRAIDGLVSRLRRKVPRPGSSRHYIRTVHGIGYSFTP